MAKGLLGCFCADPVAFPFRRACRAVRAEGQQHCWVCPWCICCEDTSLSLSPNTWIKRMYSRKNASNTPDPSARATSAAHRSAGLPWQPLGSQKAAAHTFYFHSKGVICGLEALLTNGMLGDSFGGGVGCAGPGSGQEG